MMGERRVMQEALSYGFGLERHVPDKHLVRNIDRFVDLSEVRAHLGPYYCDVGRPSIVLELIIPMLVVGYSFGIRRSGGCGSGPGKAAQRKQSQLAENFGMRLPG